MKKTHHSRKRDKSFRTRADTTEAEFTQRKHGRDRKRVTTLGGRGTPIHSRNPLQYGENPGHLLFQKNVIELVAYGFMIAGIIVALGIISYLALAYTVVSGIANKYNIGVILFVINITVLYIAYLVGLMLRK